MFMDGESASGVSRVLVARGMFPLEVSEIHADSGVLTQVGFLRGLWQRLEHRPLNSQSLAMLTRRLGDLLDAGLPMQKAVQQLLCRISGQKHNLS